MFTKNQTLSTDLSTGIPQRTSTFAIFVHFGKNETTNRAISSLLQGIERPDHIIIVDHAEVPFIPNASTSVIRPGQNTGYAGGLKAGIEQASILGAKENDLCILLNNDVEFAQNSLQAVISWWRIYGGQKILAGAAGGHVSLLSGRAHIGYKKEKATGWNIPYVHGSCMVGEFGLLSSLTFPASLFMYWEDVVLSILVRKDGGRLAVIPGLDSIHNDTEGPVSLAKLFYMVRNGAYVLERYTPIVWRVYWYGMNTFRFIYHILCGGIRHATVVRALYDARAGRLGKAIL